MIVVNVLVIGVWSRGLSGMQPDLGPILRVPKVEVCVLGG